MSVPAVARNVLLVDFDGTLYPWAPLDDDSAPLPGAVEAMRSLKEAGYTIRIFSSRLSDTWLAESGESADEQIALMQHRLERDGIPFDGFAFDKEPAEWYVDDRAVAFKNNWPSIAAELIWSKHHEAVHRDGFCACQGRPK